MRVETISYIKQHAAKLDVEEPIVVTQGGRPVYRIESEVSARLRDESIALLKMMNLAERDIRQGKTLSSVQAKQQLRDLIPEAADDEQG
ncbi:type II toxin-antitoxin system Phd/YefM family antitoxin [Lacimicrobium alkaliphilum]|uniref:Antitoxin n=1 Tax=Lacimicrobium alkaliphilum TaxID=1526571 RepID=A0ABQ1R688_9ALTE|nr:type II toxin-antitoxin system Phd/YefM family antitoxin [Lacimicrobium alkaliphilum]GGD57343.1 antitoxin [Lacimicrobium alkaliphilum]